MHTNILRNFTVLFFLLLFPYWLFSQCTQHGFVVDGADLAGCGLLILSDNGDVFSLAENPYQLVPGDEIKFSYQVASTSTNCQLGASVFLNCVEWLPGGSSGQLCDASFAFDAEPLPSLSASFQPTIVLPDFFSYSWNFGYPMGSSEVNPQHTFPEAGEYEVCLTISDGQGCSTTACEMVTIGALEFNCGFEVSLQLNGLTVHGEVFNDSGYGPYYPESVLWINDETGEVISTEAVFDYTYPDPSECGTICVAYVAEFPNGESCWGDICADLSVSNGCVDPEKIDPAVICPTLTVPVCGCDGITYANACQAEYLGGLTEWTAGPCPWSATCQAYFINWTAGLTAYFADASTFSNNTVSYNMGDGTVFNNQSSVIHQYAEEGWYKVCMTILNLEGCTSTYCEDIYVGNPMNMCDLTTGCVWPGDANGDGKANHYDLLQMGLSYNVHGFLREGANTTWDAQYAVNWELHNSNGVDFKHSDANGDGKVSNQDVETVEMHYNAAFDLPMLLSENAPAVYLDFDVDTIIFNADSPEFIEVTAGLYLGQPDKPALDVHGLALQLYYPQIDLTLPHTITTDLEPGTFMGSENQVLTFDKDLYSLKRLDLAVTRNDRVGVNGYGRLATVNYIIVGDIIGGRSEQVIPFNVQLEGVKLVDPNGNEMEVDLPMPTAGFTILNQLTTDVEEAVLADRITLFPNPVKDKLEINLGGLQGESLTLFNANGQRLRWFAFQEEVLSLQLGDLPAGIYLLQIQTKEGLVNKRIVLE